MDVSTLVFFFMAFVILFAAIMMVASKNLVHSSLFMVMTFIGVAGIYALLHADFLAVAQVLIYVGAISVLLIFGIMLTRRDHIKTSNLFNKNKVVAGCVSLALFFILSHYLFWTRWKINVNEVAHETAGQIADLLLNSYIIPFEVASFLLLVAMIGAIVIGREEGESRR